MKKIGITTTVPIEVLIAAGYTAIDLNNIFITDANHLRYIEIAEKDGFPKSTCAWIKGIYGCCITQDIHEIIGVVEGDCSNTKALIEVLSLKGIKAYPFSFPHSHQPSDIEKSIRGFMKTFGVSLEQVEAVRSRLKGIRQLAKTIDELTFTTSLATGFENHLYQVSMSDFNGNAEAFELELQKVITEMKERIPNTRKIRLGYIGVPPMTADIYTFVEKFDAQVVYNEVQREFAFPRNEEANNIFEQYQDYTYPYGIDYRIAEIKRQIEQRKVDALVHYTQAFCYRAIEDIVLREKIGVPILSIEGDQSNCLDARTKLRLEAFLDMLADVKEKQL